MSASSDKYERDLAVNMDRLIKQVDPDGSAERPSVSAAYADVRINMHGKKTWCEVKMNHTDNLANPRIFYAEGKWQTTYTTPAAAFTVKVMNSSGKASKFVKDISEFAGIDPKKVIIPTNIGGLRLPNAVPLVAMKSFFSGGGRYIAHEENINLGEVVTNHYTLGKAEPAYYMQAGDDFYMISNKNPLGLSGIPLLKGEGDFKVRVSTRSAFYEIQAEIKIKKMPISDFSVMPGTRKSDPFITSISESLTPFEKFNYR